MSELALKLIREAKEKRLTRLDLGNCGLTELPNELFELTWLEELFLSNEGFYFNFEREESLDFKSQNNGIKNNIHSIPYEIKFLTKLKSLLLNGDRNSKGEKKWSVKDLSALKNLKQLQQLSVSATYIRDLSPLRDLNQMKYLDVSETIVDDLSPLENLLELQKLVIYHTTISDLMPLKKLKNLKHLYASNTPIKDIRSLSKLDKLQLLVLYNTKIKYLDSLVNLKNLQQLFISSTRIRDLSPLKNLQNLEEIHLSSTLVSDLSPLKSHIESGIEVKWNSKHWTGKGIYVENCPFIYPPKEIVMQGNEAILRFWKQFEKSSSFIEWYEKNKNNFGFDYLLEQYFQTTSFSIDEKIQILGRINRNGFILTEAELQKLNRAVELYEAKLIIVGEGATGKTTLFEKLKDKNHQIGNTPETHGINIFEGLPFKHTLIGDNIFHANLWDFGGQELQYMTHQFFLTPRALYVLMMDARRESPNLAYWFKIISLLGRDNADSTEKVRLLLVFNKRGNTTGTPPQYQDQLKYYEDSLDVQYLEVDFAENDYRFDNLQNAIQQSLVTLPIVKSQLPRLWKAVREDLREEAKTENYIDTKRFSAICSKHGITEEADQWLLSGYLHQLGSLLHFQNDKGLRRLVILSPQWAVDGVYTFLSEESIAGNNGRFTETEFLALLARRNYNRDAADVILQLMTKNNFDICYEATEHNYVAAQLLPDNAPPYAWFPKEVLQFRYQYPIMPKGLMSRLIVRLSDDIERDKVSKEQIVWKKGVVLHIKLKEGECRVRLREDDAESKTGLRQILIDVMGDRDARKYALRKVRDTVDDLHKRWFRSIKADEMVPCCCSECTVSDNPQLYKLENLLKLKEKRQITICYSSGDDVQIQQLLEGVYDKGEIRDMENQGKYS